MSKGFVKFRRGFDEHLEHLSGDAVKLFNRLLFRADWRKGENCGLVTGNLAEIASGFGWGKFRLSRIAHELSPYVVFERRGNQKLGSLIRIKKYDGAVAANGNSSTRAVASNSNSNPEQLRKMCSETATATATAHPQSSNESESCEPRRSNKKEELKSGGKNAATEQKMFDLTDRHFSVTGAFWERIGTGILSETYRPFSEMVKAEFKTPGEKQTVEEVVKRYVDMAELRGIPRPPQMYGILKRYRAQSPRELYVTAEERQRRWRDRERTKEQLNKRRSELLAADFANKITPEEKLELEEIGQKIYSL